ncbi:2-succinyl-6-hydroxy-2,4-cyclohexadiene-1-carboxylate synthase [Lentibacillus salicampi]|uniref:Putative 2-succinyl-6-hydroxy-2,4-cyclohexadiene-1-carboxylate synthase n=1 Tax=Lentibacillus salicampi TaxID=175306 RepID=A0A4Y9AC98_9BACI|nr:2-succinyl-6-hydroxy-2,4-cyclohexadiene-1-carboxylate synthase [Lentibacillus salicampi]TFJ92807.1 2-succinyl-6-hydroxy-2,4-cyclohexadiene-1-carboxylate synthase [Lentibacillus salicampi]
MYLTINDTDYWYELNGEGEPVVLLHGFTGTGGTWSDMVSGWLEDFQTLTIDMPGHGRTKQGPNRTMDDFCRDLAGLLEVLQWKKVHLIGYSMGGRAALSFTLVFPERVKSLTLESASPGLADAEARQKRRQHDEKLAQRIETGGIKAFVDYWENIPLFQSQKQLPAVIRKGIRQERLSQSAEGLARSLRLMGTGSQPSWQEELPNLTLPVLLLAGAYDQKFINMNQSMAKRMPSAELTVVQHAGHAIHVEQPAIFGKIVSGFLKSVETGRT